MISQGLLICRLFLLLSQVVNAGNINVLFNRRRAEFHLFSVAKLDTYKECSKSKGKNVVELYLVKNHPK